MTMETRQTGTRDLVGDEEPRGRFARDDEATSREREDAARARTDTLDRDDTARDDESRREAATRDDSPRAATPASTSEFAAGASSSSSDGMSELLSRDDNDGFQRRWETIQTGFVDEPRRTVEQADELVAEVMKRLAEDVSTEDLRLALQRYRSFFQRLLDV